MMSLSLDNETKKESGSESTKDPSIALVPWVVCLKKSLSASIMTSLHYYKGGAPPTFPLVVSQVKGKIKNMFTQVAFND